MRKKVEMWCYECNGTWKTSKPYNVKECPHCKSTSRLYRTSSEAFRVAYDQRNKEKKDNRPTG